MKFRRKAFRSKKLVTSFEIARNKFNAGGSVVRTAEEQVVARHMEKVCEALYQTIPRCKRGWVWMCRITQGQRLSENPKVPCNLQWWSAIPASVTYGHRARVRHMRVISGVPVHLFVPHLCAIAFKWFNVGLSVQ